MIGKIVLKNQLFYWQKTLLVALLAGFLFFLAAAGFVFSARVKELANKPLESLGTELVLQKDHTDKAPRDVKTKGNILPFNLASFQKSAIVPALKRMDGVKAVSTALVFWQFDVSNTVTVIGLSVSDPAVGIRKIDAMLMPGGRFFTSDSAREVILERHFSKLFGYRRGGGYEMNGVRYMIVGIVDFRERSNLSNAQVFMPYETAIRAVGTADGGVNQVYVSLDKASSLERIKAEITEAFPAFSVITKDRLLANLSNLNRIVYRFGDFLAAAVSLIAALLVAWILVMYRLEFKEQIELLRVLGWPKKSVRGFVAADLLAVLAYSVVLSAALTLVFSLLIVPGIRFDSLMRQGFQL